jgi:hypothetical protein
MSEEGVTMETSRLIGRLFVIALGAMMIALRPDIAVAQEVKVTLSGQNEIPPVTSPASGTGTLTVDADKSVSGGVNVSGMTATVAHIHEAAAGSNGPIVIPLTKSSETVWVVPPGTKLTDAQFESYKAGRLYFNIHSEAHRSGEIRGQIKP